MVSQFKFLLALAVLTLIAQANAATCNAKVARSTPTDDFVLNTDGTVTHKVTQLTWMRCVVGQAWQSNACVGEPELVDWETAMQHATRVDFAGAGNWRLPNVKELLTIIEDSCLSPAINLEVFPGLPGGYFWTATSASEIYNIVVHTLSGGTDTWYKAGRAPYLLLVRE